VLFQNWGPNLDGASLVTAVLRIGGRDVACYGHDFTVRAGSMDATNGRKLARLFTIAGERACRSSGMNDSAGAYVPAGVGGLDGYAEAFTALRKISGVVPSIMCMFGFNAGGGSYLPRQGSFVIQPGDTFFGLTGPGVVKSVLGEDVSPDDLGGPKVHGASGVVDLTVPDEVGALRTAVRLLELPAERTTARARPSSPRATRSTEPPPSSTPSSARPSTRRRASTPRSTSASSSSRSATTATTSSCSRRARGTPSPPSGASAATWWASSRTTAPWPRGRSTWHAAYKNARFIRFCNVYNIPILFMEDTTGFLPGREQESLGIVQAGRALLDAIVDVRTPRILRPRPQRLRRRVRVLQQLPHRGRPRARAAHHARRRDGPGGQGVRLQGRAPQAARRGGEDGRRRGPARGSSRRARPSSTRATSAS
jgi:hypothetical protein